MPFVKVEKCEGCGVCISECPAEAISMEGRHAVIDQEKCIKCGTCRSVCPCEAIRPDSENSQSRGHKSSRHRSIQ
ncbi:MAG: 4Fe-4S binding protein [Candidatus Omnitrophica bacterium]|nr:4Fe-4S binding protein [Candidatus Omnitrophota bacterium]